MVPPLPPAGPRRRRPASAAVWEKLKGVGVDYGLILRVCGHTAPAFSPLTRAQERRQWLLGQDLAKDAVLLAEWFALIQELDVAARQWIGCLQPPPPLAPTAPADCGGGSCDERGFRVFTAAEIAAGRLRAHSFHAGDTAGGAAEGGQQRPRSLSFLEYLLGKRDAEEVAELERREAAGRAQPPATAADPLEVLAVRCAATRRRRRP